MEVILGVFLNEPPSPGERRVRNRSSPCTEGSARPDSITLMEHPCPGDDQEQGIEQKRFASLHPKSRAAGSLETCTVRW
ncbi:hypothetical protein TNCT_74561 [Trichonephila clavata]|uniref:Uncharacterized protein n=1 Tax=Trichonephila clavata TaxID=2740835 RepID=A0A8X6F046_TRICU|nr:hypothetical protein TNCT_74561 [Trichonephila clavata]